MQQIRKPSVSSHSVPGIVLSALKALYCLNLYSPFQTKTKEKNTQTTYI